MEKFNDEYGSVKRLTNKVLEELGFECINQLGHLTYIHKEKGLKLNGFVCDMLSDNTSILHYNPIKNVNISYPNEKESVKYLHELNALIEKHGKNYPDYKNITTVIF